MVNCSLPLMYCVRAPWQKAACLIDKIRYASVWKKKLSSVAANKAIAHLLLAKSPCLVARIGHTEGRIVGEHAFRGSCYSRVSLKQAHQNAGIFPVDPQTLTAFAEIYGQAIAGADLLGVWQTSYQMKLLAECYRDIPLAPLSSLEPYFHHSPWSSVLRHRRVLVVHPFAASIERQYRLHRAQLFADPEVLPEMDLQVLAPPQTLAPMTSGYGSWLEAFDHLVTRVLQCDFEVALLGCGAYGLPLGAAIKRSGRQAVHLGGALQLLFGIRGRRWESMPEMAALMNDYWIRPSPEETPASSSLVEGGCYW